MSEDTIQIPRWLFKSIGALLLVIVTGCATWIGTTNSKLHSMQLDMARSTAKLSSIEDKLENSLKMVSRIDDIENKQLLLNIQVNKNSEYISSNQHIQFNMTDYDRYVKPIQEDIIVRLNRLENDKK